MTQELSFTSRISKHRAEQEKEETPKIGMTIDTRDDDDIDEETGEARVTFSERYVFSKPDEGRLLLMASAFGAAARPEDAASEVIATLRDMLDDKDYRKLRDRIDGDLDRRVPIEDIMEILTSLTEVWAEGFPTQPSTGSSAVSRRTGGNSTGRVPSGVSTPSDFRSPDSSRRHTPGSYGE